MKEGILLIDGNRELAHADSAAWELLGYDNEQDLRQDWHGITGRLGLPDALSRPTAGQCCTLERPGQGPLQVHTAPISHIGFAGHLVRLKPSTVPRKLSPSWLIPEQGRPSGQFYQPTTSAIVHDLRAPLNAMALHLELLEENVAEAGDCPVAFNPDVRRHQALQSVHVLQEELRRLTRTLAVLMGDATPGAEARDCFAVAPVLDEVAALLMPQASRQGVVIALHPKPGRDPGSGPAPVIRGQRDYLKQAVLNIALNGLEAMPDGGTLRLGLDADAKGLRIRVEDEGAGIPGEHLSRVCDLHFSTKSGGQGLGLFAARCIIEAHGGSLRVSSQPRLGTSITCSLPLVVHPREAVGEL